MIKIKNCRYGPMMFSEEDSIIGLSLSQYGESHFHEVELFKKILKPGDVVIDAGAHIGTTVVPMAQAVGKDGYVLAIEAQPFIYNVLCGNLALNNLNNVQPLNRAVADQSGRFAFMPEIDYSKSENFGGVSLGSEYGSKDGLGRSLSKPVATISIDDLNLTSPRLIKIDVEGMEVPVLTGAINTIRRAKPVLYMEFISNREDILVALRDLGYQWKLHEPPLYNQNNFLNNSTDVLVNENGTNMVSGDLLCWHPDKPIDVQSEYFVDYEKSDHPRHKIIQKLKEEVYGISST